MLSAMGFLDSIRKAFTSGEPEVAGGDPEAQAILSEEYGAGDPDVPPVHPTHFTAGPGLPSGGSELGEASEEAIEATDPPRDPAP
jgi:hypothetical protein